MSSFVIEETKKLWATWNIRVFVIVSLSVQVFLILFAPYRKRRGKIYGKCVDLLIWSIYLLADWVAGFSIGLIVSKQIKSPTESSDIQVFWAPFLLLHLGGPDTITSFALEDNEFWVRHLLGLLLQVGSTAYVFIKSLPENKLWLPTILVTVAGIIKYAERNRAFYLASFDHLGDGWAPSEWGDELPIPVELQKMDAKTMEKFEKSLKSILWTAVHHFGTIKMTLVGPFLSPDQCSDIRETFLQLENSSHVLQAMEIEVSLLYEVLHTKLPVFDIWLTYGLLIGALLLEFMSVILLSLSDWILVAHIQSMESKFFNKRRWCRAVSQLNFITYYVKYSPVLLRDIANYLGIRILLEAIKGILCLSSQNFREDQWHFIYEEVKKLSTSLMEDASRPTGLEANQAWKSNRKRALESFSNSTDIANILEELDYSKSVLTWHIATEICWLQQEPDQPHGSRTEEGQTSTSNGFNHKEICKLLSDYMFYLLIMHPTMMAAVSVSWKIVFEDTLAEAESLVSRRSISSNEKDVKRQISKASKKILELIPNARNPQRDIDRSVLFAASALAKQLKKSYPWESMSLVWVHLMCFAAINCRPQVHAQQPSKGGELLTFVWLLMNHLGVGTHFSSHY
ncbi:hypothetical protein SLEP1_g56836 [Rubroshorea leprosula]|uniref:DUF4220 domain-containing protein n=1 Tax=Rubroshorea leprosula TaxID=152421 RepID=A0AAV5MNE5_9ROSI|nr:hypothetical protein SLEP1_g56836 [Rubroshorea leprosula]